ncbi:leucine-rich repeat and IQ domain-containing protein 1 [Amphiprion ocellaris]|uniref:Leucine-rich repeats and IQ motif containing 1 n=1 Tax=Amphiprion ocellaris TaxID=80972 RepID=A0A3Q1B528_AMPOC|nr:leucine-rich repeat and IQ domain-containing protein 1 [Amphiprion ocellaris]
MTDANEMCESVMLELNKLVLSDTDETKEEQQRLSCQEEAASDDFPASLLSYFETSKSRAAACETFILEELEDFTASHHTDGAINLHNGLNKDMMKLNEQNVSETENEVNKSDDQLYHALAETQALLTHSVPLSPNDEDEARTDEFMDNENDLVLKISEYEGEREKCHSEEMQEKEQRQQREMDFQEELRKIMEAEKLHQMELEVMERKAQERLEQELLLQQELMRNLQKQVEQERRRIEEEQQRKMEEEEEKQKREEEEDRRKMKEEEEKRKREEEDIRHRLEERERMEEEEKRKILERRIEEEGRRKNEEEQRKKKEEEEKRKSEEVKIEKEMRKKEEERKIKEIRLQEEEKRRQVEVKKREKKEEEKKNEKEEEDETINREDKKNMMEEEEIQLQDELRIMEKEKKMRDEEEGRITKVLEVMTKQEEIKGKEMKRESDEERRKQGVQKKMMDGQIRRKEGGTRKIQTQLNRDEEEKNQDEETRHSLENKDITRNEEETKTKEEKLIERQKDDMRRYKKDEEYRDMKVKKRSEQEMEGNREENTEYEADNRKKEQNAETKDKEGMQEEVKKRQEKDDMGIKEAGTRNKQTDKKHNGDIGRESIKENIKMEERILKEEGESLKSQNKNTGSTGHSLTSQLGVNPTLTTSSSAPLPNEFTAGPTSSVAAKQHDPQRNISQISLNKTIDQPDPTDNHGTSSCLFPACLPEHTEQKRLLWMKNCISWSKLSLQNRRKQKGSTWSCRGLKRAAEASSLPPLCPHTLLQSTGWKSLQEVTMVTLEDLPGCSLSTLAQCTKLRSLTLRRCGLKSLEGISHLQELCCIDLQENDISFVDCENMTSLRVLRLANNKLTSIHGLSGADSLDVLDLSHNSITRIAGLESVNRLQRLSVDHNQLISTKGLKDVYTLLHLDCSHNHLARVEGLENNALLHTLDLRGNSLAEPPILKNQVLLRELHLDDNSISSLQGLTACWLPLLQHLSAAQNRITQLPSMSGFLSLENLDLSSNCLSELCNVCENLEGCQFLQEVHLMGNPLQHESGWRSTLQRAVPGLRAIDSQQTDSFLSPPAVQRVSLASGSFQTFCQAQLQQTHDLQQHHSRELSNASSPLEALKSVCRHFPMTLKLAEDQRFAHEYGDTTVCDEHWVVDQIPPEKTPHRDSVIAENCTECPKMKDTSQVPAVFPSGDNIRCSYWSLEDNPAAESQRDAFDSVTVGPKTGPTVTKANSSSVHFFATKGKTNSFSLDKAPVLNHQDSDLKITAAVVIQQWWRKYKGNINAPPFSEKGGERGGDGGTPESGASYINKRTVGRDYAATVIQAFWRSFTLRRRLASALAAVKCPGNGEDDTLEEVDMDEFVFDEAALEKHWTLTLSEDSPITHYPVSEQALSLKPLSSCLNRSQYIFPPPLVQSPRQAWVAGEHVDLAAQRISPESSNRSKSPPSTAVLSDLSERSEKIMEEWGFTDSHTALLMLKRAQKMKSKKQQQKKHRDPFVRLALFKNCNYQMGPVEARNRLTRHDGNYVKVGETELGLQQAEKTEQMKLEQAQRWLHTQAAQSDKHSESERFLPEINSSILSGGRVQLVADPAYTDCQHHTSALWANSSFFAQPCKVNCSPRRNSLGHARKEIPSPKRVTSAPSKKERISFRDNPVQLSGGWGGGKKRDRVYK